MDEIIHDVEMHIDVLFSNDASQEERQQADSWIRDWQHSPGVIDQCFVMITRELSLSNINSRLMFVSIKTLQERIRYFFKKIRSQPELIESMLECFIKIVKINVAFYESKDPNHEQNITITPQLQFALMSICDIITMSSSYFFEIEQSIPDCLKMLFLTLFFEERQEKYYNDYLTKDCLIQNSLVEYGIEVLKTAPMSVEWMRCFGGIVSCVKSCEMIIPLIYRLPESIESIDTISLLLQVLKERIYSGNLSALPFIEVIIEFHIAYSKILRQLAESEPRVHPFLQTLWSSFFQIDAQCDIYKNIDLLIVSFQEFLESARMLKVDVLLWGELLENACSMICGCKSNKALDIAMEPIKIAFFQLCSRQYMDLLYIYYNIMYNHDDSDDLNGIVDISLLNPEMYNGILSNLHMLSKKLLTHFLLNEDPKTLALLKIAGLNASCVHKHNHELLLKYAEFALTCTDYPGIIVSCSFIYSAFKYVPEYIIPFISYTIQVYHLIPAYACKSLFQMSRKYPQSFLELNADILTILVNLLKFGQNPSNAVLILTILNVVVYVKPLESANPILDEISSFCNQFATVACTNIRHLHMFVDFINYINKYKCKQEPLLDTFKNNLSVTLINSLGAICIHPNYDVQDLMSSFFESLIKNDWLSDLSIASDYIQQIVANGITQCFHIYRVVIHLPLDLIPLCVFDLCNSAFIPLNTLASLNNANANSNMNVNVAEFMTGSNAAEDVVDSITDLIFKVVSEGSFRHLALFMPFIFTEIILNTHSQGPCNNVFRTIIATIDLSEHGVVSSEILVCILRGCTKKAFRCERYEKNFLLEPMKKLSLLMPQEEFVRFFLESIPAPASEDAMNTNGNNPAINYLNVIINPASSYDDCNLATNSFVEYFTMTAEQSI